MTSYANGKILFYLMLCGIACIPLRTQNIPGIPEPGLALYGQVLTEPDKQPVYSGQMSWTVTPLGGTPVTVPVELPSINTGQFSYSAQIPFETVLAGMTLSSGVLQFPVGPAQYTHSVTINGQPAQFVNASDSAFSFGPQDRGAIRRVDLLVNASSTPPSADTDGDGIPDEIERAHGTNPQDPNDSFRDVDGDGKIDWSPFHYHPADRDQNWSLDGAELGGYATAYKKGNLWLAAGKEREVPQPFAVRAAVLWKKGEDYEYVTGGSDFTLPKRWVPTAAPAVSAMSVDGQSRLSAAAAPDVAADMPRVYEPSRPLVVTITVTPPGDITAYAVEDAPPAGWIVTPDASLSIDSRTGRVKWLFYHGESQTLSYTVTPPPGATGKASFAGTANFDGITDMEVGGIRTISDQAGPEFSFVQLLATGEMKLMAEGAQGLRYEIQASADLISWSRLGEAASENGAIEYVDAAPAGGARFYRLKQVE